MRSSPRLALSTYRPSLKIRRNSTASTRVTMVSGTFGFMPDALQIRSRLADWIDGRSSLSEFEDWFVPETWNIHKASDAEAEDLTDEIELSLSEYSGGHLTLEQLKESLRERVLVGYPFASD